MSMILVCHSHVQFTTLHEYGVPRTECCSESFGALDLRPPPERLFNHSIWQMVDPHRRFVKKFSINNWKADIKAPIIWSERPPLLAMPAGALLMNGWRDAKFCLASVQRQAGERRRSVFFRINLAGLWNGNKRVYGLSVPEKSDSGSDANINRYKKAILAGRRLYTGRTQSMISGRFVPP